MEYFSQLSSAGLGDQNCVVVTRSSLSLSHIYVVCNHHIKQIVAWGITFWMSVGVIQSVFSFVIHGAVKEN